LLTTAVVVEGYSTKLIAKFRRWSKASRIRDVFSLAAGFSILIHWTRIWGQRYNIGYNILNS